MKTASIARWTGLLVGVSLALVSLVSARIPSGTGEVPAHVSLVAERSVKLGVTPAGRELLREHRLVPGRDAISGLVRVSNLTSGTLELEPRLRVIRGELPDGLHVEVTAGRRTLYDGTAVSLDAKVRLEARAQQPVRFRFSAPAADASSVRGRATDLSLRWTTRTVGR